MAATIEELRARVFAARDNAHIRHHATLSYAQHVALGDFYDQVVDKIDAVVEVYQGAFGLISAEMPEIEDADEGVPGDIAGYLKDEVRWIQANRDAISKGITPVQNLIDDLMATYLLTIYKLVNLK